MDVLYKYTVWNLGCSFITLRELCNNQWPRCDIAWLHVTKHLYHGFPQVRRSQTYKLTTLLTMLHRGLMTRMEKT